MVVAILKYNAGNIRSVSFALERLGVTSIVTDESEILQTADKVIIPGVGEAGSAMSYLCERKLDQVIVNLKQPTLGICLGMQLMCSHSDEKKTRCLGIFEETVRRFPAGDLKVPHMGWNSIENVNGWISPGLEKEQVYFVHSYFVPLSFYTTAECVYGFAFSAAMRRKNFFATQFHPEKSATAGERILQDFLKL